MDPRVPEFHQSVLEMLVRRVNTFGLVADLLNRDSERLTSDHVHAAIRLLEADLPSPLRPTLFDLGRLLEGNLPTEDIPAPPRGLKIFNPES